MAYNKHTYVIEEDRIRVLAIPEAIKFWRAWWEEEQKRHKK